MTLRLTVITYRGQRPPRSISASFGPSGGTIGRGASCTWILPDQYEIVSRLHCQISFASGSYWITDTASKNGVSINGGPRVEAGTPVPLAAGDRLAIGDYVVEVKVDPGEAIGPIAAPERLSPPEPGRTTPAFAGYAPASPAAAGGAPMGAFIEPLFGGAPPSAPQAAPMSARPPIPQPGSDWLDSPEADITPIAQQVVHVARAVAAPAARYEDVPLNWNPFAPDEPDEAPEQRTVMQPAPWPQPAPAAMRAGPQTPPPVGPADMARLLAAFIEGAGLPAGSLPGADPEAAMRAVGERFRALVGGLRELLIARAQVMNHLRVARTVIGASPGNPLKTSTDDQQAVMALLVPGAHSLDGERAIAEAFRDLKQHEFALLAGARSAIAAALAHFDPEILARRLANGAQGSLAALVPMARKAKYWELFEAEFRRVADEAEEDAHGPLARALARAYEEQKKNC